MDQQVARVVDAVRSHPDGITLADLVTALRDRWPQINARQVLDLLRAAGDVVSREADGRFVAAPAAVGEGVCEPDAPAPLRIAIVDLETAYRMIPEHPFEERRIHEIGAVRWGTDSAWADERPAYRVAVRLPQGDWVVGNQDRGELCELGPALDGLADLVEGADVLVAHNGVALDFAVLDEASHHAGRVRVLPGRRVDSLYLAYCVWPFATSHKLFDLCDHAHVDVADLEAHNAFDDATALGRLLDAMRTAAAAWPVDARRLLTSAVRPSLAWQTLLRIAGLATDLRDLDDAEVVAALERILGPRRALRRTAPPPPAALTLPDEVRGGDGRVSPFLLARLAAEDPQRVEERPAQVQMAARLHVWLDQRRDGLTEAPTGTGKSLAALAVSLDWLAASVDNRAVIATHTKQLQNQLAGDVERIAARIAGLEGLAGVIKGKVNRLSLRTLVEELADAGRHTEAEPAELLAYLVRRVLEEPTTLRQRFEARSVDVQDLPPFLTDYLQRAPAQLVAALSQATGGDYELAGDRPITFHTEDLTEALAHRRLVVTNHALLLQHPDEFDATGERTLLVIDEAHALEDAVTAALSSEVGYGEIEGLCAEARRWQSTLGDVDAGVRDEVGTLIRELERQLDGEVLPNTVMRVFDALCGSTVPGAAGRAAPLLSHYTGETARSEVRLVLDRIRWLSWRVRRLSRLAWSCSRRGRLAAMDRNERERHFHLLQRASALAEQLEDMVNRVEEILGPQEPADRDTGAPPAGAPAAGAEFPNAQAPPADGGEAALGDVLADDGHGDAEAEGEDEADGGAGEGQDARSNWLIWAQELPRVPHRSDPRSYRFALRSSPIELARYGAWSAFRRRFAATVLMSATLRVSGGFDFIRARLGLGDDVDEAVFGNPFDLARQARVLAFADFPSWAEHQRHAIDTVAHQVAGFVSAVGIAGNDGEGWRRGAMVLTTSTAAAAGIAEATRVELSAMGSAARIHPAPALGTRVAVDAYDKDGGVLVGTKGLWAGVDVSEPERTRLLWINKLPFPPAGDPLIGARMAAIEEAARERGDSDDPRLVAMGEYYLPLAAMELRQGVGRLIRGPHHRGVIVISDRKLAGDSQLRRLYRRRFLASLDAGLWPDPEDEQSVAGLVVPMEEGWRRIWGFLAQHGDISPMGAAGLSAEASLRHHCLLPSTRRVLDQKLTAAQLLAVDARGPGALEDEVRHRCTEVLGGLLGADKPLKAEQSAVIERVVRGLDTIALLPTGFGKSFCYQLPALVLPGITVVVSPLVSLMQDQALELNRTIGGAVRALVAPMRESNSREGKREVFEALTGGPDHGIQLLYMSPERFAHRQVRSWLERAAQLGILRHVAIDEAHTLAQWGEDFRPSFRRLSGFLDSLRSRSPHPIALTALTATATTSVVATLRQRVFGLHPTDTSGDPASFGTVQANPIRVDLAVYRKTVAARHAGPAARAALAERIVDAARGHTVVYCLTVREVETLYHQLRDHVGPQRAHRVLRFHGRLASAEKAAVLDLFRAGDADDDTGPLVVIATSAFGLGIDKGDIRCVYVASPPTDISALYQQLGRAGRDQMGVRDQGLPTTCSPGLALGYPRGFRTAAFMASRDLPAAVLRRIAARIIAGGPLLDTRHLGREVLEEALEAGELPGAPQRWRDEASEFSVAAVWVLAALADLCAVDDLGDLPSRIRVRPGVAEVPVEAQPLVGTVLGCGGGREHVDVADLHQAALAAGIAGVEADDCAGFWVELIDAHNAGWIDVSQAPSRETGWLTGVRVLADAVPEGFATAIAMRTRAGREEVQRLQRFLESTRCANVDLAEYFGVELPPGVCSDDDNRCSAHWARHNAPSPELLCALVDPLPLPPNDEDDPRRQARVDAGLRRLLGDNRIGLGRTKLRKALGGEDSFWSAREGRLLTLAPRLRNNQAFGSVPGVREREVGAGLDRLVTAGIAAVVEEDGRRSWRLCEYIEADRRRAEREAARRAAEAGDGH